MKRIRGFVSLFLIISVLFISSSVSAYEFLYTRNSLYAAQKQQRSVRLHFHLHPTRSDLYEHLESELYKVSDAKSPHYGTHWTTEKIASLVGHPASTLSSVSSILQSNYNGKNIEISVTKDTVSASFTVSDAERMLSTEIHEYQHNEVPAFKLAKATSTIQIPSDLQPHVWHVQGVSRLPRLKRPQAASFMDNMASTASASSNGPDLFYGFAGDQQLELMIALKCSNGNMTTNVANPCAEQPPSISSFAVTLQPFLYNPIQASIPLSSTSCASDSVRGVVCRLNIDNIPNYAATQASITTIYSDNSRSMPTASNSSAFPTPLTTPHLLSTLYGYGDTRATNSRNRMAVVEFLGEYMSTYDLSTFFSEMGLEQSYVKKFIGPNDESQPGGEASLDIQWMMAVARNVSTEFWSYSGGNEYKEPYADWQLNVTNTPDNLVPYVFSVSYGDMELSWTADDIRQANMEFMKMGLRGITVVFSSGDDGVCSFGGRENMQQYCSPFTPEYPATSPYVLSVGATQLSTYTTPSCSTECPSSRCQSIRYTCSEVGEIACSADTGGVITTGGGFSVVNARPQYQDAAVETFLQQNGGNLPPPQFFNSAGRATPDVAALGHNYLTVIGNRTIPIYGTSASAPTFAGIIALLNDARLNAGLPTLGFINPLIYQMYKEQPAVFRDIVMGNNKCLVGRFPHTIECSSVGFFSTPGWDPVTGVGTPRFQDMLSYIQNSFPDTNGYVFITQAALAESTISKTIFWEINGFLITTVIALTIAVGFLSYKLFTSGLVFKAPSHPNQFNQLNEMEDVNSISVRDSAGSQRDSIPEDNERQR